jgi:hypothetical protein
MCFQELLAELRDRDITPTTTQIRWAITSGKVSRPPLDGSLRFRFGAEHVDEFVGYFGSRRRMRGAR